MGKLGPHEGIELGLMLSGKKAMSFFSSFGPNDSPIPNDFEEHIKSGKFDFLLFDKFFCVIFSKEYKNNAEHLVKMIKKATHQVMMS